MVVLFEFVMFSVLPFFGRPIELGTRYDRDEVTLIRLFGPLGRLWSQKMVKLTYASIAPYLSRHNREETSDEHKARLYITYLLSSTVFADFGSTAHIPYLPSVGEPFDVIVTLDWGTPAYACVIRSPRRGC